jgi:hypothetical protein
MGKRLIAELFLANDLAIGSFWDRPDNEMLWHSKCDLNRNEALLFKKRMRTDTAGEGEWRREKESTKAKCKESLRSTNERW